MCITSEFESAELGDQRLNSRLKMLSKVFEKRHGQSICFSCEDWKTSKAAYRFFDNDRFSELDIIQPHIDQSILRAQVAQEDEKVLVLHDTTEINLPSSRQLKDFGYTGTYKHSRSNEELHIKGMLMHLSMATTQSGLPLGILNQKLWSRSIKNRRKIRNDGKNFGRIPVEDKESFKWIEGVNSSISSMPPENLVHICDRDADMYELFYNCLSYNTNFVIRAVHQRSTVNKKEKVFDKIPKTAACGEYNLFLPKTHKRKPRIAKIKLRYYKVELLPPIDKAKEFCPIELFVISAKEQKKKGVEESDLVDWKILTNMSVQNFDEAIEKINWYKARWSIEVYFKILKSGFGIERSRLLQLERLKKYIALVSVIAWRIHWLSIVSRDSPDSNSDLCFTKLERNTLIKLEQEAQRTQLKISSSLAEFMLAFARLGGYLARKSDPPPGPIVLWRAMIRLNDIVHGGSI